MKLILSLFTLVSALLNVTYGAAVKPVTLKTSRPIVMASLKVENENTQYKVLSQPSDKEALLERSSAKLSNKTIKIPKGLAANIKSELLSLSWQAQYKSVRNAASGCDLAARIDVENEDTVKICKNQKTEVSQIHALEVRLNNLINSKK